MQKLHYLLCTLREPRSDRIALKFGQSTPTANGTKGHHEQPKIAQPGAYEDAPIVIRPTTELAWAHWVNAFFRWRASGPERSPARSHLASTVWCELFCKANEMGLVKPQQLTPQVMEEFLSDLESRGLTRQSIRARLTMLNGIFNVLVRCSVLSDSPV